METAQKRQILSLQEYQQLEEETSQRYEYHNGEVFAMAGGEPKHNAICHNLHVLLGGILRKKPCNVFTSDQKVHIASINRSLYPDVSVTCGPVERAEKDTRAIVNPVLLVEVLSESTAGYDRGDKFKHYSKIPTLREYVLVQQDEPSVQIYYRSSESGLWQITWIDDLTQPIPLQSLEIEIPLEELYLKTENL